MISPFIMYCKATLPTAFGDELSYYETLTALTNFLNNQVLPVVNENDKKVAELTTLVNNLKNYMDNYFNNLDVQEEINNKLDEMVENGDFENIVEPIIAQYYLALQTQFNSLSSTVENNKLNTDNRLDNLQNQITNLQNIPDGSTSGDAALDNIRTDFTGKIWNTPGEAVRGADDFIYHNTPLQYIAQSSLDNIYQIYAHHFSPGYNTSTGVINVGNNSNYNTFKIKLSEIKDIILQFTLNYNTNSTGQLLYIIDENNVRKYNLAFGNLTTFNIRPYVMFDNANIYLFINEMYNDFPNDYLWITSYNTDKVLIVKQNSHKDLLIKPFNFGNIFLNDLLIPGHKISPYHSGGVPKFYDSDFADFYIIPIKHFKNAILEMKLIDVTGSQLIYIADNNNNIGYNGNYVNYKNYYNYLNNSITSNTENLTINIPNIIQNYSNAGYIYIFTARGNAISVFNNTNIEWLNTDNNFILSTLIDNYTAYVGLQFNIYFSEVFRTDFNYTITVKNAPPNAELFNDVFRFTPTQTGDYNTTIYMTDDKNNIVYQKTINIIVTQNTPNYKVMIIGDSLTQYSDGQYPMLPNYTRINLDNSITYYGTRDVEPILTEGRYGWGLSNYCKNQVYRDIINPFYNPDTQNFDFTFYMSNNPNFADVNIVVIFLGRNDNYNNFVYYLNIMTNSIHNFNANIKIIICAPYQAANIPNFKRVNFYSLEVLNYSYNFFKNKNNIIFAPININLDDFFDFQYTEQYISNRNHTQKRFVITDAVHPSGNGFKKLADSLAAYISSITL